MSETPHLLLVQELIRNLTGALSSATLYAPEHPRVTKHLSRLLDTFTHYSKKEAELRIVCVDDELLYQGKPLKSPNTERFARYCTQQGIGFIMLAKGLRLMDLLQMIKILLGQQPLSSMAAFTSQVQLGSVAAPQGEVRAIASFTELPEEEKQGLQNQFDKIAEHSPFEVKGISSLVGGFISAFRRAANPFLALVPLRRHDEYTFTHSVDVGILNIAQGMALGIDGQMLHDLGLAGMLHDAGKLFIDQELLNKPGTLSEEDFARIRQHPSRGAQYLMNQDDIPQLAIFSAYEHHMRYDLTGYPPPPKGWTLNICSQITMISDTFDALRTRRAYKGPWDFSKASGLMLNLAGKQLNPDLTLSFLKTLAAMGEDMGSFDDNPEDAWAKDEILGCSCSLENPHCG